MGEDKERTTRWMEEARAWMEEDPDPVTRDELKDILDRGDTAELKERFAARLEFGTAGLRGVLGAGPNRMNRALVRKVTAGLARYLLQTDSDAAERGVVVGRDARHMSREFAEDTARVLAGAGIRVHLFPGTSPTPLVAYAVENLHAAAGVVVTASHNPPEYNGYKVYWSNGAQIIPPHDTGISRAVDEVGPIPEIPLADLDAARAAGLIRDVPETVGDAYLAGVLALPPHPEVPADLDIVYTPMHGVGGEWVRRAFREAGFGKLHVVPEQAEPDGDFPTVRFPNPEEPGAMDLALALARREGADLVLANDPDVDRLAVIVREAGGEYRPLSGNEIGTLLGYYLLTEGNDPPAETLVVTTVVSSSILRRMAEAFGCQYRETLTGFKWIANKAMELRESRGLRFLFGFEEALGYTVRELVRDKDGIGAALVFANLAAFLRARGDSVLGYLETIHRRFGLHVSRQVSRVYPGADGRKVIEGIMAGFRQDPPQAMGGARVLARTDIAAGTRTDVATGIEEPVDFPRSNVLLYELEGGSRVLLRPSGTEPKIKYYFEVVEPVAEGEPYADAEARARARLDGLADAFLAGLEERKA